MIQQQRLVKEFCHLVSIDSPSFSERTMGDYLKSQLISLGFAVTEDETGQHLNGNCGNIYGFLEGDPTLSPILFCMHMDTVEPARNKKAVVHPNGRITSNGDTILGADDCAGIAAVLTALRTIKEEKTNHRPIEILFTVAEEVYCKGVKTFDFSMIRAKHAYVLDLVGSIGTAAFQAPSILSFTITFQGKSAHAGFAPEAGIHAIQAAAEVLTHLPCGRVDTDTTLNIGRIQGGTATNIVPDRCVLQGEIRSYSHEKALTVWQQICTELTQSEAVRGVVCTPELEIHCIAYEIQKDHPVCQHLQQACKTLQLPYSLVSTFGGSDNNVLVQHGITGLVLASAMNQCHSCHEYTTIEDLQKIASLSFVLMTTDSMEHTL